MKISLVGYMGAGKTTVGQQLSLALNKNFHDLDTEIEKTTGYTITETLFNKGELYFRQAERQKLEELLEEDNSVLSTGGGTPCYYDNMALINAKSISIYLQYTVGELYERLEGQQAERPLIAHLEGSALREYIGKHLFERHRYYNQATLVVAGGTKSPAEIVAELKALIHE